MPRAIDPFEEYLRKKKVELLEQKYRQGRREDAETDTETLDDPGRVEETEVEARLEEEVQEFFDAGVSAAEDLISGLNSGLSEDEVDEIRDRLDDVFEEDPHAPQAPAEETESTFVEFFRNMDEEGGAQPEEESAPATASAPPPEETPAAALHLEESVAERYHAEMAPEVTTEDSAQTDPAPLQPRETRLDLVEILAAPTDAENLHKRIDLLCRLMAKVVERTGLPESELIEVLIKAGVEF